ncbi:hypothetical protein KMA67_02520 [Enterococcus durans]|uniref:hypothetical protein n=1 Tax=Enterococcus durans TaxID=53345 RepID=UPI001D0ACE06|nr:hypothetical protein [Enterococcus durans]MCB8504594.1 hypothetical protein [Enterococcus durans]
MDDRQKRKSQLYLNAKVLYTDGKAPAFPERKRLFQQLEAFSAHYHSKFDILSQSECLITATTERRQQTLQSYVKKYQRLRVYVSENRIEPLSILVRLKERQSV